MLKIAKGYDAVSKTFRLPEQQVKALEAIADEHKISLNKLVVQCLQYALENIVTDVEVPQMSFEAELAEKPKALAAYKSLNIYKDDDSGKLMGDYLLDFDFSDNAEKQMTETFMQANSQIILGIMQQASFAGDDGNKTRSTKRSNYYLQRFAYEYRSSKYYCIV